ncbi:MAG: hypothetical protein JOZ30_04890 [Hyphomicrobiales bacterium]|nr:hypothetical protein [Hyphomicrobiales bacterium]
MLLIAQESLFVDDRDTEVPCHRYKPFQSLGLHFARSDVLDIDHDGAQNRPSPAIGFMGKPPKMLQHGFADAVIPLHTVCLREFLETEKTSLLGCVSDRREALVESQLWR